MASNNNYDGNDARGEEDANQHEPPITFDTDSYQTRDLKPGDVIQVHHNEDDNETVLTDLQTIEYIVGQRSLFPATEEMSSSDADDNMHPLLNTIFEEDGRSASTPGSKPVPTPPHHDKTKLPAVEKKVLAKNVPDPDWKTQLDAEIRALPSQIPTAPPQIRKLNYNDQKRTSKEQGKNNPEVVARAGGHAQPGTSTPDPNWKEYFELEINPLPTPEHPVAASQSMVYDNNRGRATKQSVVQDPATDGLVGAFSQGGPAFSDSSATGLPKNSPGEVKEENSPEEINEEANEDRQSMRPVRDGGGTPILVLDDTIPSGVSVWQKKPFLAAAVLLLVVVVVAVVLPLVGSGSEDENPIVNIVETVAPTHYVAPIPSLSNSTLAGIEVPDTVAYKAYNFVIGDPNWNTYEDWRRQQRFAMACVIYAFGGPLWGSQMIPHMSPVLYTQHECDWYSDVDRRCPDGDGIIKVLAAYRSNNVAAHVPPEVELLPDLQGLVFNYAWLVSFELLLPLDVPNSLPALREIRITESDLSGVIPSALGLITTLTTIELTLNNLESSIPSELGLLPNLNSLLLSKNKLSGTIPEELGSLSMLEAFEIEDNSEIEPLIPSGFCSENHTAWKRIATDWCSNPDACCAD